MKVPALILAGVLAAITVPYAERPPSVAPSASSNRPALVLLIAVDQFRYDYLTRFRASYSQGLDRLLTNGAVFTNATLDHYPTVTAIGHATMLTGATPSVSGIIGNDWYDREAGGTVTSVSDSNARVLGAPAGARGSGASPSRLLVSTVGDELKMSVGTGVDPARMPRVIGVSLKDRAAILPAGRGADAAFWFDTTSGAFVTSSYYMAEAPPWLLAFNGRKLADAWAGKTWTWQDAPSGQGHVLPSSPGPQLYDAVFGSPFGNDLLLALATEVLDREQLGRRGVTDLLSVSFSSNDSVGHTYGPDSPEVRDISVKTDRVVGELLRRVDAAVGLDRTIVAFTADHGVAPLPEAMAARHMGGGRFDGKGMFDGIQRALEARFGPGKWVLATAGSSPYLDHALMAARRVDPAEVRRVAAAAVLDLPHVARVYTRDQLERGDATPDVVGRRVLNGFNQRRSGDLEILLDPYWIRGSSGTTHGTPYNYDAHIPLILMGQGIRAGRYSANVVLNDLAPTLATLLDVEVPGGASGRVLTEAIADGRRGTGAAEAPMPTAARP